MVVKKLLSYLLLPFPASLILLVAGLAFLWFTRRVRTGKVLVTVACTALLLFSCGAIGRLYGRPLTQYPPLAGLDAAPEARWIVVLGAGYAHVAGVPATSLLGGQSLERVVEAVRLYRTRPGVKVILSGGAYRNTTSLAAVMARATEELGVPAADIVREDLSDDTQDEARLIRRMVGEDPFVLVTSAFHMRRSMRLFEKQGMKPTPAPAGFWNGAWSLLPQTGQLALAEAAEHEYIGMLWSALRGDI